ncbi:polysaccharide deacetylase family protein [Butyricicoccus sp.]|uniref:polysaccharide deacetylase family protein n=1 Tax=Butyricicoccus sp. TaxID=2049021 RepID=UPI003F18C09B
MDHEFDRKPEDSQDKHEQAKTSFEDLQKLMEQFKITADEPKAEQKPKATEPVQDEEEQPQDEPVLSVDELIERAVSSEEQPAEEPEEPAEVPEETEESPEQTTKASENAAAAPEASTEEPAAPVKPKTEETKKKPAQKKPAPRKKVIRKKEMKPELTQEELEQQEREAILEGSAKRRHPDQPTATVNLNQTKKSSAAKKTAPNHKKHKKNSKAAMARRRKKRMMRLGTVVVLLLVAVVLVVSAVKVLTNRSPKEEDAAAGSAVLTEEQKLEQRKKEGPASQQETKQYLAIKDDDSLPSYAKEYPGLYAKAVDEPNILSDEKVCYLTFDDGPSTSNTPGILDILKKENVKATFFVVTSEIDEETEPILQRIVDEGHTLCIHANEHEYGDLYASTEAYLEDFANAYDKIYELTGYRVQGFRFPGGSNGQVNSSGCYDNIVTEMTRRGFEYYDWNAYSHDAEGGNYSPEEMADMAVHEVDISSRNDVILLMHDTYGKEKTVSALEQIISQLKEAGIEMLPITNSTRPVHFEVSDATPQEYDENAEEESDSTEEDSDSSDSDGEETE